MFGSIGGSEFLLIAVLALLLFGPRKLPQIGRTLGRALAEFRGATHEFKSSLEREVQLETLRDAKTGIESVGRDVAKAVSETTSPNLAREPVGKSVAGETESPPSPDPPDGDDRSRS